MSLPDNFDPEKEIKKISDIYNKFDSLFVQNINKSVASRESLKKYIIGLLETDREFEEKLTNIISNKINKNWIVVLQTILKPIGFILSNVIVATIVYYVTK